MLPAETVARGKHTLTHSLAKLTHSLAKSRQKAEAILKTYRLFISGRDKSHITNSFCINVLKVTRNNTA
jgi:glycine cleavage system regulatory protein